MDDDIPFFSKSMNLLLAQVGLRRRRFASALSLKLLAGDLLVRQTWIITEYQTMAKPAAIAGNFTAFSN